MCDDRDDVRRTSAAFLEYIESDVSARGAMRLLVTKGLNRAQPGSAPRRIEPPDHAERDADDEGLNDASFLAPASTGW